MTFTSEILLRKLAELSDVAGKPSRYVVALSGGLDSVVLTHALATSREEHGTPVVAVHIDHGLHDDSATWSRACEDFAATVGIEFKCSRVDVERDTGRGLEAAAREARYAALEDCIEPGDWLLSAHHQDDQAETLLLNLVRGSGPAGLAGIGLVRRFGDGWLVRPLLGISRRALQEYAAAAGLRWTDDPSNTDQKFDRNYVRHEIMVRLEARWPDVAVRLSRSAQLAGEASELLTDLAALDAATLGARLDRLAIDGLRAMSVARQRNLLRYAARKLGLPMPTAVQLQHVVEQVIAARDDAQPLVRWPGAEIRRYRNQLYLLRAGKSAAPADSGRAITSENLVLDAGLGVLRLQANASTGLSDAIVKRGLELRYRSGGEEFHPYGQSHTRKLKKLLQEEGVVPWMRDRIPLVYAGGELVAAADLWIAADAASQPGTAIRWSDRPAIH